MHEPDVFIHIGLSKCASTYLQKIIFPAIGNYSDVAFAPDKEKYSLFSPDLEPEEFRKIVAKHMTNPQPDRNWLLISCEDYTELLFKGFADVFYRWKTIDKAKYIYSNEVITRNIARTYPNARIIIVIREQLDWAVSRYKMIYRGGKTTLSIDELLVEPLEGYDSMIERYQKQFGKEHVRVLPLEMMRDDRAGFINSISGFIGTGSTIHATEEQVNTAPEFNRTVEYERLKNRWRLKLRHAVWLTPPGQLISQVGARILVSMLKPFFILRYGNSRYEVTLSDNTIERLRPLLAKCNSRVEKLTGLDLSRYGYLVEKDT